MTSPAIFRPFAMERWQSTYENVVDYNLSESGVHPLSVGELLRLGGLPTIDDLILGYGQSNGSLALRERIAALYPGATPDGVLVTNGSAEANFAAMWELVRPGDEVAIVVPTYMQTYGLTQNLGAVVRQIPLRAELNWQLDPEDVASAVSQGTRLLVVTNPNNPTGAILSEEGREAVVAAADRAAAWILADEVYTGAELDGNETPSLWGSYPRVIATGSLSKAYGLPGLRIGWTVSDAATAADLWSRTDYTTISPGELTDRLATLALTPAVRQRIRARTREIILQGLGILENWMGELGVFHHHRPAAGAICFAGYDLPINSSDLAERLRAEQSVLIVPGDHFGLDRYIRFGYGLLEEPLRHALERMGRTIGELAGVGT